MSEIGLAAFQADCKSQRENKCKWQHCGILEQLRGKNLGQDHWLSGVTRRRFALAVPSPFVHISFTASK